MSAVVTDLLEPPVRALVGRIIIDSLGRKWNSALHPRDRKGQFIETFSEVRAFLTSGGTNANPDFNGIVEGLDPDGTATVRVNAAPDHPELVNKRMHVPFANLENVPVKARIGPDNRGHWFDKPAPQDTVNRLVDNARARVKPEHRNELASAFDNLKNAKDGDSQFIATRDLIDKLDRAGEPQARDEVWNVLDELRGPEAKAQLRKVEAAPPRPADETPNGVPDVRGEPAAPESGRGQQRSAVSPADTQQRPGDVPGTGPANRGGEVQPAGRVPGTDRPDANARVPVADKPQVPQAPPIPDIPRGDEEVVRGRTRDVKRGIGAAQPAKRAVHDRNGSPVETGTPVIVKASQKKGASREGHRTVTEDFDGVISRVDKNGRTVRVREYDEKYRNEPGQADREVPFHEFVVPLGRVEAIDLGLSRAEALQNLHKNIGQRERRRLPGTGTGRITPIIGTNMKTPPEWEGPVPEIPQRRYRDANGRLIGEGDWVQTSEGILGVVTRPNTPWNNGGNPNIRVRPHGGGKTLERASGSVQWLRDPNQDVFLGAENADGIYAPTKEEVSEIAQKHELSPELVQALASGDGNAIRAAAVDDTSLHKFLEEAERLRKDFFERVQNGTNTDQAERRFSDHWHDAITIRAALQGSLASDEDVKGRVRPLPSWNWDEIEKGLPARRIDTPADQSNVDPKTGRSTRKVGDKATGPYGTGTVVGTEGGVEFRQTPKQNTLTPEQRQQIAGFINELAQRFPQMTIPYVFTHDLKDAVAFAGGWPDPYIGIAPPYLDDKVMQSHHAQWEQGAGVVDPNDPSVDAHRRTALIHEAAHVLHYRLLSDSTSRAEVEGLTNEPIKYTDINPKHDDTTTVGPRYSRDPLIFTDANGQIQIRSAYSVTNDREWFAEAITDAILNGDNATESGKRAYAIAQKYLGAPRDNSAQRGPAGGEGQATPPAAQPEPAAPATPEPAAPATPEPAAPATPVAEPAAPAPPAPAAAEPVTPQAPQTPELQHNPDIQRALMQRHARIMGAIARQRDEAKQRKQTSRAQKLDQILETMDQAGQANFKDPQSYVDNLVEARNQLGLVQMLEARKAVDSLRKDFMGYMDDYTKGRMVPTDDPEFKGQADPPNMPQVQSTPDQGAAPGTPQTSEPTSAEGLSAREVTGLQNERAAEVVQIAVNFQDSPEKPRINSGPGSSLEYLENDLTAHVLNQTMPDFDRQAVEQILQRARDGSMSQHEAGQISGHLVNFRWKDLGQHTNKVPEGTPEFNRLPVVDFSLDNPPLPGVVDTPVQMDVTSDGAVVQLTSDPSFAEVNAALGDFSVQMQQAADAATNEHTRKLLENAAMNAVIIRTSPDTMKPAYLELVQRALEGAISTGFADGIGYLNKIEGWKHQTTSMPRPQFTPEQKSAFDDFTRKYNDLKRSMSANFLDGETKRNISAITQPMGRMLAAAHPNLPEWIREYKDFRALYESRHDTLVGTGAMTEANYAQVLTDLEAISPDWRQFAGRFGDLNNWDARNDAIHAELSGVTVAGLTRGQIPNGWHAIVNHFDSADNRATFNGVAILESDDGAARVVIKYDYDMNSVTNEFELKGVNSEIDVAGFYQELGFASPRVRQINPTSGNDRDKHLMMIDWAGSEQQLTNAHGAYPFVPNTGNTAINTIGNTVEELNLADPADILRFVASNGVIMNNDRHNQNLWIGQDANGKNVLIPIDNGMTLKNFFQGQGAARLQSGANIPQPAAFVLDMVPGAQSEVQHVLLKHFRDYVDKNGRDKAIETLSEWAKRMREAYERRKGQFVDPDHEGILDTRIAWLENNVPKFVDGVVTGVVVP